MYLYEFKYVCDQLSAIGKPVDLKKKIYRLLIGFPQEYEVFKTVMFHTVLQDSSPSYDDTIAELKAFESRSKLYLESTTTNLAFYGARNNFRGNVGRIREIKIL